MGNIPSSEQLNLELQKKSEINNILNLYTDVNLRPNYVSNDNAVKYATVRVIPDTVTYTLSKNKLQLNVEPNKYFDYNNTIFTSKMNILLSIDFILQITNSMTSGLSISIFKNNTKVYESNQTNSITSTTPYLMNIRGIWTNDSSANIASVSNDTWSGNYQSLNNTTEGCIMSCHMNPECVGWAELASGPINICYLKRNLNNLSNTTGAYNTRTFQNLTLKSTAYISISTGDTFYFELNRACTVLNTSKINISVVEN